MPLLSILAALFVAGCQTTNGEGPLTVVHTSAASVSKNAKDDQNGLQSAAISVESKTASASTTLPYRWVAMGRLRKATLEWESGHHSATMAMFRSKANIFAEFQLDAHPSGLRDCAGDVTREGGTETGHWRLFCASGEAFNGTMVFTGTAEAKGSGADKQGAVATLTLSQ